MRVFVATQKAQGRAKDDFCDVPEGEIVAFSACDRIFGCKHDKCRRSLIGLFSRNKTTTFMVTDKPLTQAKLGSRIFSCFKAAGLVRPTRLGITPARWRYYARQHAASLVRYAARFPAGTVCEKKGRTIRARS